MRRLAAILSVLVMVASVGAALQRDLVVQVDRRVVQRDLGAGRPGERGNGDQQREELCLHHQVTRCGSGFSASCAVYQGISAKKRK